MSSKVSINLYDLSQGMAKNMSRNFLGKQIDGIWHTGIVVYGKEFYYGGGICQDPPGRTPYGNPIKSIPMGETEIPEDIFLDFLKEINCKFTAEKYDLFENNCNNFSDACSEFLTGTKIPNYITGLPREVLNTPMGQMIKPMIDRMQKGMTENSHPMFSSPNQGHGFGAPNHVGTMDPTSYAHMPHYAQQQSQGPKGPISITDANEFSKLIKNSAAVIVDFFSYTCPPCMKIKPFYERLAQDFGVRCPDLKFVSVDTGIARQIAMNYQITSIPTFIAFLEGSQFQRFSGADAKRVETLAYTLESKIIAKGGQSGPTTSSSVSSYNFNLFNPSNKDFYTFSGTNYALPIKSINTTLEGFSTLNQAELKETFTKFSENPQESVQKFSKEDKTHLINWLFETIFYIGISDKTVGLLDLVRMLSLDHSFLEIIYTHQERIQELVKFLDKSADNLKELPKGLKLVLLRLLTNLTASEKSKPIFQDNLPTYIDLLTKAGTAYKDDKTAVHPVVMTLWNLVQNFYDNKSFEQAIKVVINFVRTIYNTSNETDVLLGCSLVLTWLSFHRKEFRNEINDKIEMPKLAKLEFIEDPNLGKISRDFSDILRGKAN